VAEPKGKYVKKGDVEEWEWDGEGPGTATVNGGWVVPEGEFDPRGPADTKSASEKVAEASQSKGLRPAQQETVTTKTAAPLTKGK